MKVTAWSSTEAWLIQHKKGAEKRSILDEELCCSPSRVRTDSAPNLSQYSPFAFKRTVYLLPHDWHNTKPDVIHENLQADGSFHKVAISRGLFFPAVLFFFILIQCQSCFGFARHLKNISEQLFTIETKVALCGLSQHFLFLGAPWEAAGCPQLQNKQANDNKKTLHKEKPNKWKIQSLFSSSCYHSLFWKQLILSSGRFSHIVLRLRIYV